MDLSTRQGRREQGQRIQQAVERAGLSIEELAGRLGCSRALIYQYLSGSTLAQPDRLQQIASICSIPLTYFYSETPGDIASSAPTGESSVVASVSPSDIAPPTVAPGENASTSPSAAPASLPLNPKEVTSRLNDGLRSLQELAAAQEGPPDYRALASTCERILSLSAQLGDRDSQAQAQLDLGIALNKIGDFPRAVNALNRAVALAVETGHARQEMSARQSLGRALTMMGRNEQARGQFQQIAERADFYARWRGLLSLGSLHELQGEYQQAMARFEDAAALLEEGEENHQANPQEIAVGLLYVNTNRRNVYMAGGDLGEARRLAEQCLADAESLGMADQNLEARLDLGWCDLYVGRWAQAQQGLSAMLQLARFVGDKPREIMARVALGILQAAAGDFDAALAQGKDTLALAISSGDRMAELYAQLVLADAYTGPGDRSLEARYHATQALAVTTSVRYQRSEVECRLRLARLNAQTGDNEGLRESASRALALAQNLGARHLESLAHAWLAESYLRGAADRAAVTKEIQESVTTRSDNDTAQRVEQEAASALTLSEETGFVETRWRAQSALARLARYRGQARESETRLRAALAVLESLRESLRAANVSDSLLENVDCLEVYAELTDLLIQAGRASEAAAFLEQVGWPPLTERFDALLTISIPAAEE